MDQKDTLVAVLMIIIKWKIQLAEVCIEIDGLDRI